MVFDQNTLMFIILICGFLGFFLVAGILYILYHSPKDIECERKIFYVERFSKIPYGFFIVPSSIIILQTFLLMVFFKIYSLDPYINLKYYLGDSNLMIIFFKRFILIITLALILWTAKRNLDQIYNLKDELGFLFLDKEKGNRVFNHINNDVFHGFPFYRLIYLAIPIEFLYFLTVNYNEDSIPWHISYLIDAFTYSIWWTLILYGTYSGVISANIVLYLFDSKSSALQSKNEIIKKINGIEIKFEDIKIKILHPDKLGGLGPVRKLLQAPIIIGFSAIINSTVILNETPKNFILLFMNLFYYFLILMCAIIPPLIFSQFLSKKKEEYLKQCYNQKKFYNNYNEMIERMQLMKTSPFDTKFIISIVGLIVSIGIQILFKYS